MRDRVNGSRVQTHGSHRLAATSAAAALVVFLALPARGAEPATDAALPRSTPERQGISPSDILAFVEAADTEIDDS